MWLPVGHAENDSGTMKQNDLQEIGFVCPKNAMNLSPGTGLAPFGTGPAAKRHARGPIERYNDAIDRSPRMPRLVRCSLIQAHTDASPDLPLPEIKRATIDKHLGYIRQAAEAGAQIVCLQELFNGPYFCAEQQVRWYDFTEPVPDGPTIRLT